jgi:hypothetical protein
MVTRTQTTDAPGDIDYNFGENGKVFLNFRDAHFVSVWNMAFTQDRKILFVGSTNMNEFVIG